MSKEKKALKKFFMIFALLFLITIFELAIFTLVAPDKEYSLTEKRTLAEFPTLNWSSLADGSFMAGMEDWMADQFPGRDSWMKIKSNINIATGAIRSQGVYRLEDGSLMEEFNLPSNETLQEQSNAITGFAALYPDANFYFCLAPNAISVLSEKLPAATLTDDQNVYINHMANAFSQVGTFVDIREAFEANKSSVELYYHTDHHWTTDGAYIAWKEIYTAMELNSEVQYTSGIVSNRFSGSLVSASGFPITSYDNLSIYIPDVEPIYTVTYNNTQNMTASVYSMEHLNGNDPYEVFFGGNHPKITIRTAADTDRTLLIIKDSYANCMIPFFLSDFSQIVIIDARYYSDDLGIEMQSSGYTDVLFLYNVNTLAEDNTLVPVLNNATKPATNENGTEGEIEGDSSNGGANNSDDDVEVEVSYTIDDIAFIGDSRTLSLSSGGNLAYRLVPGSSVFATWGGKIIDESASANAITAGKANKKIGVFWYGINDAQSSDLDARYDVERFRENYEKLIDLYLKENSDSEIVILSILTTSVNERDYYEGQEENIKDYNEQLKTLCEEKGYTYIDISVLYTGEECFAENDFIHFSKSWYENNFIPFVYNRLNIEK